jgi:hypothetical protein
MPNEKKAFAMKETLLRKAGEQNQRYSRWMRVIRHGKRIN